MRLQISSRLKKYILIIFNINKVYRVLLFVFVSALLISQLALTLPAGRAVLTNTDNFEGIYKNGENQPSTLAEITLTLVDAQPCPDIEILQNGQPIAIFYEEKIKVTVSDNSVLEIDGRRVNKPFSVVVSDIPSNIDIENIANIAQVNSDISLIGRIFVK
ncbi:MAG: hypothetical protein M0R40_09395 [Firmicutes bacterium]|nr:hypothetical protein [Bacillota bacterium]